MVDSFITSESTLVPTEFPADRAPRRDPDVGLRLSEEIAETAAHISAAEQRMLSVLDRTVGSRFYYEPVHGRREPEVA